MKALLLAFLLAQGADLTTTTMGLHRGCVELNPMYRTSSVPIIVVGKSTSTLFIGTVAWGAHKKGHSRAAKIVLWTGITTAGMAAIWNIHTLSHC